jgi:hypothetical protein
MDVKRRPFQREFFRGKILWYAQVGADEGQEKVVERRHSLKIEVPNSKQDVPRFGRVGVIALIGFAIGIAWPRLAGLSLPPAPPVERSGEPLQAEAEETPQVQAATTAAKRSAADRVKIGQAQVTSCRDSAGGRKNDCGNLDFDQVARGRIHALAECDGAESATGVLSIGFQLDFEKDRVTEIESGKSTTLPEETARALVACAREQFQSASLKEVEHQHKDYMVYYMVEFLTPQPEAAQSQQTIEASGRATVSWQVALIRNGPKDGEVVARILSGTRVVVTGRQGDWFRVKYDAKGNEGWVYKAAIGL